ncbi:MAG: hypothetical protein GF417_12345 [Candidatus Latescibacteria bacterium]|nr:hypothetical protein [Candidatus Latescibacterota bacterium]
MILKTFAYTWLIISFLGLTVGYGKITYNTESKRTLDGKYYSEAKSASWGEIKSTFNNGDAIDDGPDSKRDKN